MSARRGLFPEIEPFNSGRLKASEIHEIYYEQYRNKKGNPVLSLHGGPGSGSVPRERRFFDPVTYRIILFDQRGTGKSTPAAELRENTTWHLVEDMDRLRKHLGIDKWVLFGGSWGATLSLAYAETHPSRVKALILRGIFGLTRREMLWSNQDGANYIFPDAWEEFLAPIPEVERVDLMSAYFRCLTGDDEEKMIQAGRAWNKWKLVTCNMNITDDMIKEAEEEKQPYLYPRIETYYLVHGGWLKTDDQLLKDVEKVRHIPGTIIHGRYDVLCPMETA
ncbi:probable proline iminopeptidase [Pecten maximus]|uniref:probable proline iminopeptidase n=1 Tax=Pecten maximus TaxID=6579 RepID=UPI001458EBB6|nr:probable proline iminopeptidase [Pecten maximus]